MRKFDPARITCRAAKTDKFSLSLAVFHSSVLVTGTIHSLCMLVRSTWGTTPNLRMLTYRSCQDKAPSISWYRKNFRQRFPFRNQSNIFMLCLNHAQTWCMSMHSITALCNEGKSIASALIITLIVLAYIFH